MFSICTKGMADCLNLTPGGGTARLTSLGNGKVSHGSTQPCRMAATYLQRATPSFSPSRRSEDGSFAPSISSIHVRTSLAAAGVYLSRRNWRKSLSRDVTDAIFTALCDSTDVRSDKRATMRNVFVVSSPSRVFGKRGGAAGMLSEGRSGAWYLAHSRPGRVLLDVDSGFDSQRSVGCSRR